MIKLVRRRGGRFLPFRPGMKVHHGWYLQDEDGKIWETEAEMNSEVITVVAPPTKIGDDDKPEKNEPIYVAPAEVDKKGKPVVKRAARKTATPKKTRR